MINDDIWMFSFLMVINNKYVGNKVTICDLYNLDKLPTRDQYIKILPR